MRIILLTLKELQDEHNDANMIVIILNILFVYAIRNKLKYFVINNVINNDIMLKIIAKKFHEMNDVYYDSIEHRLRCIDHIINLFIQTFLFDKHLDIENDRKARDEDDDDDSSNIEL